MTIWFHGCSIFLDFISVISLGRPNFVVATLWVPCHYFDDDNDILSTNMIPSWSFRIESLNSASFGDKLCALRTCITMLHNDSSDDSSSSIVGDIETEYVMGYGSIIESAYNLILDTKSVALPVDILHNSNYIGNRSPIYSAVVAQVAEDGTIPTGSMVLYPDHPASEPCVVSHSAAFGGRFGIPLYGKDGKCYARPCSAL